MLGKRNLTLTKIVFSIYFILLAWLILFKLSTNIYDIPHMRNLNLVPFGQSVILNGKMDYSEIIYNIIVFIPLGIYMMILNLPQKSWLKLLVGFIISIIFETIQYIFSIGGSDITDVIANTVGVFVGIILYNLLKKLFKHRTEKLVNYFFLIMEIIAVLGYLFLIVIQK